MKKNYIINKLIKSVLAMGICVTMISSLTACDKKEEAPVETTTEARVALVTVKEGTLLTEGTITVAIHPDSTDYIKVDADGKLSGFEIDLMKLIGDVTLTEVKFVKLEQRGLYADLDNGKYDCIISSIPMDEDVDKVYDFSATYYTYVDHNGEEYDYAILVKTGNNRLINVLNQSLVTLKQDGRYDALLEQYFGKAEPETSSDSSGESSGNAELSSAENTTGSAN